MRKFLGLAVGAVVAVGIGIFWVTKNPELFNQIITWALSKLGIS